MSDPQFAFQGPGGRWYEVGPPNVPEPFRGPSVTTILSAGLPAPALQYWSARSVAEYAYDNQVAWQNLDRRGAVDLLKRAPYRTMTDAGERGTDFHNLAEALLLGEDLSDWAGQQKTIDAIKQWLDDFQPEIVATEQTVVSYDLPYAGTYDLLAKIDGELVLCDWKTSKGIYEKFALQLAAYAKASYVINVGPMPKIDRLAVLHLRGGKCKYFPVQLSIEDLYAAFTHVYSVANFEIRKPTCFNSTPETRSNNG